ncbi:MAG: protein kinase [Gemmatimonadota bacterium]|nr:protein kinase [Gemmatimonadota bacterium]MDH4349726.1 protein kinase [Gemmatimonadota bacterium]MDH5196335.1 protein kinase [Gemmatimonadota bacterium]
MSQVAQLRHDLRTPVNHIVGYAEMLLEDLPAPAHERERAALEGTLVAARDALQAITLVLAPTRDEVDAGEVEGLYARLADPQRRIADAVRGLLAAAGEAPTPTFADDLARILAAAERLVPRERAPAAGAATTTAARGDGQARILVVDDEPGNRDLLQRRLERDGYAVICAGGGREALAAVGREAVDLVLLDMLMPDMDGLAVLQHLKGDPATRDLPVIVISALDDLHAVARCIEAGAEDYLPKPFDPVILRARLAGSLQTKRWRDQERDQLRALGYVTAAASAVEGGTYQPGTLSEVAARGDAIGRLARVMDRMAVQVRERESRLRERLDELRSEIGVARRSIDTASVGDGPTFRSGERLGTRYEILSVLGRGGMGTVYRARDLELGEEVAIKTVRPELVSDETFRERFKDEIRLARRISHRNVVRTHDFGETGGVWYLTMEYVEGITLRELLDTRGRLAASVALAVGTQLAECLAVAHEVGVIHRDIKPQNLLLDADGVLKVLDFGVARLAERSAGLTEAGLILGTPAYMSPEQITSEPVDERADLYAAGAVLYECLTGRPPLEAASMVSLIARVLADEPPAPSTIVPDVPPALDDVVLQLLAKRPQDRPPSAAVLVERLQALA